MSHFEDRREELSHFLLRNEILARFGISAEILGARDQERIERIASCIEKADPKSANIRAAIDAWYRGGSSGGGVEQAAVDLFCEISKLTTVRPTVKFPSETVVYSWIKAMDCFIASLDHAQETSTAGRHDLAKQFAEATAQLIDFLANLNASSKAFCAYFEPAQR